MLAHTHTLTLHKNEHFSDSAAFALASVLVFYSVLFKALFNTCYRNDSILLLNQRINSSVVNQT